MQCLKIESEDHRDVVVSERTWWAKLNGLVVDDRIQPTPVMIEVQTDALWRRKKSPERQRRAVRSSVIPPSHILCSKKYRVSNRKSFTVHPMVL